MLEAIFEFIFDLMLCELDTIFIFVLLNRCYGQIENHKKLIYLSSIIATFLVTIGIHYTGNYTNIFSMIIYLNVIGFYPTNFKKKILFNMSILSLNISILIILNDITNIFPQNWIILGILCYHISFWGILRFSMQFDNNLYGEIPNMLWYVLYAIPTLCIMGTFFSIFLIQLQNTSLIITSLYHLPIQITFFIINMLVFVLYAKFAKFHLKSQENALILQQMNHENKYFKVLEESWNSMCEIRHDMKNQLKTALFLYQKNSHEKLIHYLEDSLNQLSKIEEVLHTGNMEIDALLNIKLNELSLYKITYSTDVIIPSNYTLPVNDIIIILGNLFDNGIDACKGLPISKRFIDFKMHFTRDSLFIHMKNPFDKNFIPEYKKRDKVVHGFGLKIIKKIVDKHTGIMSYESQNNIFSIDIILYTYQ